MTLVKYKLPKAGKNCKIIKKIGRPDIPINVYRKSFSTIAAVGL